MKKRILIESEEKNRIINLHKGYLTEQQVDYSAYFDVDDEPSVETEQPAQTNPELGNIENTPKPYTDKYVKEAQKLLGVSADGKFGPKSLQALKDKIQGTTQSQGTQPSQPSNSTTTTTTIDMGVVYGAKSPSQSGTSEEGSKSEVQSNKDETVTANVSGFI